MILMHSRSGGRKNFLTRVASSLLNYEHHHRIHHHYPTNHVANLRTFFGGIVSNSAASVTSLAQLSAIVNKFPPGIDYSFGYGSGVLRQQPSSSTSQTNGINTNPGMIDIILATENPHDWHKRNLLLHSDHYSLMARIGGPKFVTWLQLNFGAKLYFHPFVDINIDLDGAHHDEYSQSNDSHQKTKTNKQPIQRQIKYGVVSTDDLIQDLLYWDYLYLAGRMHKPIVSIDPTPKLGHSEGPHEQQVERLAEIEDAQRTNLLSAVSASLLLHNTTKNEQSIPVSQLYTTIASLSYTGDFRMHGAEDPNKVKKLVETPEMMNLWGDMYSETLGKLQVLGLLSVVDGCQVSDALHTTANNHGGGRKHLECNLTDLALRKQLVQHLPPKLRKHSDQIVGTVGSSDSIQHGSAVLRQELANIVAGAAKSQSVKGFFTAGVSKSWKYALAKLAKGRVR
ncbi:hypothetical protein ACHAXR_003214 [Thalassiosira sp. AJA248-18]